MGGLIAEAVLRTVDALTAGGLVDRAGTAHRALTAGAAQRSDPVGQCVLGVEATEARE